MEKAKVDLSKLLGRNQEDEEWMPIDEAPISGKEIVRML